MSASSLALRDEAKNACVHSVETHGAKPMPWYWNGEMSWSRVTFCGTN